MRIAVIGCGYVGLVTGACLADMGHTVACVDIDAAKLAALKGGRIPIFEPGLAEIIADNQQAQRLSFTEDLAAALAGAALCFVAVGTPPAADGAADTRAVFAACDNVVRTAQGPLSLVIKSTVPPGTCDALFEHLKRWHPEPLTAVISNPEFLKEGMAVEDFRRPDRIVVGAADGPAAALMRQVYAPFLRNGHPLLVMDTRSAEMAKYVSNVMLAARISLINEVAGLCERVGADIAAVRHAVGADTRIGTAFLYAGLGYGGSCFPKDVQALRSLATSHKLPGSMLEAIHAVNERQKTVLVGHLLRVFDKQLKDRRIAVWGLSFKPRTDDVREAPALAVVSQLLALGACVVAYDPVAMPRARATLPAHPRLHWATERYAALDGADALMLCTEWDLFRTPDFDHMRRLMKNPLIFDGRNQYEPTEMQRLGFRYFCVGRRAV